MSIPPTPPKEKPFRTIRRLYGHDGVINRIAWAPAGNLLATTSFDRTVRIWDISRRDVIMRELEGHRDWVSSVSWSGDNQYLASGSRDNTIRIWDVNAGQTIQVIHGHERNVFDVDWSAQSSTIASASGDASVGVWNPANGELIHLLAGHEDAVYCVKWSPNGRFLASGSEDCTVRIWEAVTGAMVRIIREHNRPVYSLAWSPDGIMIATASADYTVRVSGRRKAVLEGHTDVVGAVAFSHDGRFLASRSLDGTVRVWRTDNWDHVETLEETVSRYWTPGLAFHPKHSLLATPAFEDTIIRVRRYNSALLDEGAVSRQTIRYTNAKVVLVGESGVGKSSLAEVLCGRPYRPTDSSDARKVWRFDTQDAQANDGVQEIQEILLWDMGGQPGFRLIQQLYLNQVTLGLLVFDTMSDSDPLIGVRQWHRALHHARSVYDHPDNNPAPLKTFLVSARVDRAGVGVTQERINRLMEELPFDGYYRTSAMTGLSVPDLAEAVRQAIDWDALPKVSSTRLFQRIKNYLADIREDQSQNIMYRVDQLYDTFVQQYGNDIAEDYAYTEAEMWHQFMTCIGLVESQGLIKRFSFDKNLILLQPEMLDAYASAMITAAKDENSGMGSISEEAARAGSFHMVDEERLHNREQEELLLIATIEDLIRHEIAIRDDEGDGKVNLVFPSQSSRSYPNEIPEPDAGTLIWRFNGPVLSIYATLLVRLWNTGLFKYRELYENAAFYTTDEGTAFRIFLKNGDSSQARLLLFGGSRAHNRLWAHVEAFVDAHLQRRAAANSVQRVPVVICANCKEAISERTIQKRREKGFNWLRCPVCDERVSLGAEGRLSAQQTLVRQRIMRKLDKQVQDEQHKQMMAAVLQGKIRTGRFDVFLCHNSADSRFIEEVCGKLKAEGIYPWLDIEQILGGMDWQTEVQKAMEVVRCVAFFMGVNGPGKEHLLELRYALEHEIRVIPVVLPDVQRKPSWPMPLVGKSYIDFRKEHPDPIAQLVRSIEGDNPLNGLPPELQ